MPSGINLLETNIIIQTNTLLNDSCSIKALHCICLALNSSNELVICLTKSVVRSTFAFFDLTSMSNGFHSLTMDSTIDFKAEFDAFFI